MKEKVLGKNDTTEAQRMSRNNMLGLIGILVGVVAFTYSTIGTAYVVIPILVGTAYVMLLGSNIYYFSRK